MVIPKSFIFRAALMLVGQLPTVISTSDTAIVRTNISHICHHYQQNDIPGHLWLWHDSVSLEFDSSAPATSAAHSSGNTGSISNAESQNLVLVRFPPPQDCEQELHAPHSVQYHSTEEGRQMAAVTA